MGNHVQLTRLGLFDARVPRYTSYPTAPHFSPAVGPGQMAEWIAAIPAGSAISLYVHVPFCRKLCWFCACRTQGTSSDEPVRAYTQVLLAEIALLRRHLAPGVTLSRLHWGGGTPTLLSPALIRALGAAILTAVPLGPNAEFSVEIDPGEIDADRLDALAGLGLTRASIGIQDFDPSIQAVIGRIQSYELTESVAQMILARAIASLNTDVLYGLPHQTPASITDTVGKVLALAPDRVALYGYAHVPWMARRQVMLPTDALPAPPERLVLSDVARALFLGEGYTEIGIDHFARPSDGLAVAHRERRLRRNFQGYTDDAAPVLVGLGASAISRFPQGYAQNAPATSAHVRAIRDGRFSTARGHAFAGEDALRGRMIEALMCDFRIDAAEITAAFNPPPGSVRAMFAAAAARFPGMVDITPWGLSIRPEGRPLTRMIAQCFDAYALAASGHSSAV